MLKLIGVETYYGKVKALHGVSLEVKEGQLVTILGANGAGKSTILKTISGLVEPEYGTIHFEDRRIDRKNPEDIVKWALAMYQNGDEYFRSCRLKKIYLWVDF